MFLPTPLVHGGQVGGSCHHSQRVLTLTEIGPRTTRHKPNDNTYG